MKSAPQIEKPLLWEAFHDLGTMRVNGMAMGQIPYDKIVWYANDVLDFEPDETEAFVWIMRRVDTHYVNKMAERMERNSKAK